ncbi:inositol monophosphatase [Rhodocytophaga aerolata]|uniref:Inositol monophosphatase n=1 Tax=Rhodocytophaga aerolata TaxID=455078 RepID=A0ABT8QXX4_9BACT|nr:inositol monophosphatase [Rhodocytophaga aerolata]MDO1444693.1 inositol monophosphatase [Rhodocytophaga aerolata]
MHYTNFLNQTLALVSGIATRNFGKVATTIKTGDNNQVLTQTDLEIGQKIIESIEKSFPTHNIIDEEAGVLDKGSAFTWVVDPIDGTSNFANGIPTYGIMIGLLEDATPIASGIALPAFGEMYIAEKNKGAYCNGQKLAVTEQNNLLAALVAYGVDGHQENPTLTYTECRLLAEIVLRIRNLRCSNSVFDLAMLARGSYGAVLNRTSRIWDNVAIHILVEEAGGKYTDFFGKPMDYTNPLTKDKLNYTFCAAAPLLHEQLQQIIHQYSQ